MPAFCEKLEGRPCSCLRYHRAVQDRMREMPEQMLPCLLALGVFAVGTISQNLSLETLRRGSHP